MPFFHSSSDSKLLKNVKVYSERITIVIVLTILASVIPNFVAFLNIVGSIGTCILGFILPPLYYMKVFKNRLKSI